MQNQSDLQKLRTFRKEVLKRRNDKYLRERFSNDIRQFIPLETKCSITKDELTIPIRSIMCKELKCIYNLEAIIERYQDKLVNDKFKCHVCNAESSTVNMFFDSPCAYFLQVAKQNYEDFDDLIDSGKVTFGLDRKKRHFALKMDNGELVSLHELDNKNQSKQGKVDVKLNNKKSEQVKLLQKEILDLSSNCINQIKDQAKIYSSVGAQNNVKIDIQSFINEFKSSLEENISIQQSSPQQFYIGKWFYTYQQDYNYGQTIVCVHNPTNNKWYKTALRLKGKYFQIFEFTSSCKGFDSLMGMHSIFVVGGQNQDDRSVFLNTCYQIPLFVNSPDEIKAETEVIRLPDLPNQKAMPNTIFHKNQLFVFGGFQRQQYTPESVYSSEFYDLQTKQWQVLPNMSKNTLLFSLIKQGEQLYFLGGYDEKNQNEKKTVNKDILLFDFNRKQFGIQRGAFPDLTPIQDKQMVKYFMGRGMSFIKPGKGTFCFLGGRELDSMQYHSKEHNKERRYFMSEYNLSSQQWQITDTYMEKDKADYHINTAFDIDDKKFEDFEPVYYNNKVYFGFIVQNKNYVATFDEYGPRKFYCTKYN